MNRTRNTLSLSLTSLLVLFSSLQLSAKDQSAKDGNGVASTAQLGQTDQSYTAVTSKDAILNYHSYLFGCIIDTTFYAICNYKNGDSYEMAVYPITLSTTDQSLTTTDLAKLSQATDSASLLTSAIQVNQDSSTTGQFHFLSTMYYLTGNASGDSSSTPESYDATTSAYVTPSLTFTWTNTTGSIAVSGSYLIGVNNTTHTLAVSADSNPLVASTYTTSATTALTFYDITDYAISLFHNQNGKDLALRIYLDMAGQSSVTASLASTYFASWHEFYSSSGDTSVLAFTSGIDGDIPLLYFMESAKTFYTQAATLVGETSPFKPLAPSNLSFDASSECLVVPGSSLFFGYYFDDGDSTKAKNGESSGNYLSLAEDLSLASHKVIHIRYDYALMGTVTETTAQYSDFADFTLPEGPAAPTDILPITYATDTEVHFENNSLYQCYELMIVDNTTSYQPIIDNVISGLSAGLQVDFTYRLLPTATSIGSPYATTTTITMPTTANKDKMKALYDWYSTSTISVNDLRKHFYTKIHQQCLSVVASDQEYVNYLADTTACLAWRDDFDTQLNGLLEFHQSSDSAATDKLVSDALAFLDTVLYNVAASDGVTYKSADFASYIAALEAKITFNRSLDDVAKELVTFYEDLASKKKPTTAIQTSFDTYFQAIRNATTLEQAQSALADAKTALKAAFDAL